MYFFLSLLRHQEIYIPNNEDVLICGQGDPHVHAPSHTKFSNFKRLPSSQVGISGQEEIKGVNPAHTWETSSQNNRPLMRYIIG